MWGHGHYGIVGNKHAHILASASSHSGIFWLDTHYRYQFVVGSYGNYQNAVKMKKKLSKIKQKTIELSAELE